MVSGARGVHLTLALPDDVDDRAVARDAIAHGVTAIPLSVYAMRVAWRGLVLSFAATPVAQIAPLVARSRRCCATRWRTRLNYRPRTAYRRAETRTAIPTNRHSGAPTTA